MGKGEGKEKGGQAEAGKGGAEGVAAGAEGQGEGQGQRAAEGPGADPFDDGDVRADVDVRRKEWRSQRESVIADILEVWEDEGEGAGRMAVLGHANCTLFCAPNAQKKTSSQQGKKTIF